MKNNIGLFLSKRALLNPNREAYVDGNSTLRLSFEALNRRCNQVANTLLNLGLKKGDRVGIMMMNSAEFVESYFAIAKIGGIVVPLNWRLVPDELEFILKDSGTRFLLFGDEFVDAAADIHSRGDKTAIEVWLQVTETGEAHFAKNYLQLRNGESDVEPEIGAQEDDLLYIMYTSGTTGLPKGVVHTHNTCFWAIATICNTSDMRDGDIFLSPLPLFHVGALTPVTLAVYRGMTSLVMREFDPLRAWQLLEEEKVNTGLLVPAMLNFMLQVPGCEKFDCKHLRWILSGASPLPVNLIKSFDEMGIEIHQIYGLTETCGPACVIDAENSIRKIGSTGRAFFHTNVKVVSDDGTECAPGEQGEVWVKGPHIMTEYWNRPEDTAETLVDGWLRSGDVAVTDDEGFIYIQDRIKDMIISGGENVYPAEIENVILAHPEVAEVEVIGQPSERWGESPFAVIVRKDKQLTEADVLKYCNGKLARFKLPQGVSFVSEIPRNPSGKVLKRLLREDFPGPAAV